MSEKRPAIRFYAFDLPFLNGDDLRQRPLHERKERLEKLLSSHRGIIRFSASLGSNTRKLLAQARRLHLEGLIGKRAESVYESARRSGSWIKLKLNNEQEIVIGGYTDPNRTRKHLGALLIGYYDGSKLRFAGKVGTGFDDATLASLHSRLKPLEQTESPFGDVRRLRSSNGSAGLTAAEMKRCHWVKPKLVGQVKFTGWTRDGKLRHPVFLGLREDKAARDIVRERPSR